MFGKEKDKSDVIETLPMVPLRDVVVFPHMMIPFVIGRPSSIKALEYALVKGKRIFLSAQHDATRDNPGPEEIHTLGTICNIVQSLKLPDGNVKVLVEGLDRGRALEFKEHEGFFKVVVKLIPRQVESGSGVEALMSKVIALFEQYVKLSNNLHYDTMLAAVRVEDPGKLADTIASHLVVGVEEKQNLLEIFAPQERLTRIHSILEGEVEKLQVDKRIQGRVKKQMERAQKEYYLNEKMKAIQKELGRKDDRLNEIEELRKKIEMAKMPKEAEERALQELKRLEAMPPMSAEATVSRNYLDWLIAVPWSKRTRERKDLLAAEKILNEDHYGLEKVKERIIEFLDPEQNHSFTDHYIDVEFDLSSVFFIATANVMHTIPQPLQDRMEVLRLPGYTEPEKVEIAKRHLVAKQVKSHGLEDKNIDFTDEALQEIVRRYTREAGVRNMEREISSVFRKVARRVVLEGKDFHETITADNVTSYLGIPRYRKSKQE